MAPPPSPLTLAQLERTALAYLGRQACTVVRLRQILRRAVLRRLLRPAPPPHPRACRQEPDTPAMDPEETGHRAEDEAALAAADALIEALLDRYQACGLLNDQSFAEARSRSLNRRGASGQGIRARLSRDGVPPEAQTAALATLADDIPDPDLAAALTLARRRRLGPFRPAATRTAFFPKDQAALARAGFSHAIIRAVMAHEPTAHEPTAHEPTAHEPPP